MSQSANRLLGFAYKTPARMNSAVTGIGGGDEAISEDRGKIRTDYHIVMLQTKNGGNTTQQSHTNGKTREETLTI